MNLLFLSNPARNYHRFFNALASVSRDNGHTIFFAADSNYSEYINNIREVGAPIYNFEKHFSTHETDHKILSEYSNENLNSMLLGDFERRETFNSWGRQAFEFTDKLKSSLISFFTEIIDKHKIDAIIFEDVAGAFSYFALSVCKRKNIQYVGLTSSRLPGRFFLSDDPLTSYQAIEEILESIASGQLTPDDDLIAWSAEYLDNIDSIEPDYMAFNGLESLRLTSNLGRETRTRMWMAAIKYGFRNSTHAFGIGNPLHERFAVMRRAILRLIRAKQLHRYYSSPKDGENYLLYPLHYHPEASTSLLAGTYLNEYEVIRNIAFNLPEGIRLYVKDHRSAYGYQDLTFYKSISHLPNVKLIEPFAKTKSLIRSSLAVITLTSTVGYEALLLGKRVFLFGNVFYQFHPNVVRIKNPANLFDTLRKNIGAPLKVDRDYNLKFIQAYHLSTYPGHLHLSGENAGELAKKLYPTLLSHITSTKERVEVT